MERSQKVFAIIGAIFVVAIRKSEQNNINGIIFELSKYLAGASTKPAQAFTGGIEGLWSIN